MSDYQRALEEAVSAWSTVAGLTDVWARHALRRLVTGEATELEIAQSVYRVLKPRNPAGELVSPKLKGGRVSVRNLENATVPVAGAAAARSNLEAVLLVFEHREQVNAELNSFIRGDRAYKLYGLRSLAKERSD
jgi:hypothetical protein